MAVVFQNTLVYAGARNVENWRFIRTDTWARTVAIVTFGFRVFPSMCDLLVVHFDFICLADLSAFYASVFFSGLLVVRDLTERKKQKAI